DSPVRRYSASRDNDTDTGSPASSSARTPAANASTDIPTASAASLRRRCVSSSSFSLSSPSAMDRGSVRPATRSIVEERAQLPRPARVLQLAERLGFDLADTFAGHRELLADFFQRVVGVHADAEAHAQDTLLARRQRRQHAGGGLAQVRLDGR